MKNCKEIKVKILERDNASPKEVREIWTKFFDRFCTPRSIFEEQKNPPKKKQVGSVA